MALVSWTCRVKEGERREGVVGQIMVAGGAGGASGCGCGSVSVFVLEVGTAGRRLLRGRCRSIAAYWMVVCAWKSISSTTP